MDTKHSKTLQNKIQNKHSSHLSNHKRASLACAARMADTSCPPEDPFGRLDVTLVNYNGDKISEYICPTVLIDFNRKVTKFVNF